MVEYSLDDGYVVVKYPVWHYLHVVADWQDKHPILHGVHLPYYWDVLEVVDVKVLDYQ